MMKISKFYNFAPEKIRVVDVELLNRSSVVFFMFLLDNHPELITNYMTQIPKVTSQSIKVLAKNCYNIIVKRGLWNRTRYSYPFSLKQFFTPFKEYIETFGISRKTLFIASYYATAVLLKRDLSKIKFLVFHAHDAFPPIQLSKEFDNLKRIITLRDPRAALWSKKFGHNKPIYLHIADPTILQYIYRKITPKNNIFYLKHEDLHTQFKQTRKKLCSFLKIRDGPTLNNSTVFGKLWDGSKKKGMMSSKKQLSTKPDPKFVTDDWKDGLTKRELFWIQKVFLKKFMKEFKYKPYISNVKKSKVKIDYEEKIEWVFFFLNSKKNTKRIIKIYRLVKNVFFIGFIFRAAIPVLLILILLKRYLHLFVSCAFYTAKS